MPGMMDTVLNLGMNDETEAALAAECADPAFARNTHRRFLDLYAHIVLKSAPALARRAAAIRGPGAPRSARRPARKSREARASSCSGAVRAVFESWNSRRARRYRQHHGIPDDLGTAVTMQAMVFGNLDARSGTGVLFSRNPLTGEPTPYGEYLPRAQGEDVVSGKFTPEPLSALARELARGSSGACLPRRERSKRAGRDVQDIEFTIERGRLYFLQSRAAKLAPHAAVRIAVDFVREGLIDEDGGAQAHHARAGADPPCARTSATSALHSAATLASGEGASPGVGIGVAVRDSDEAEQRAQGGRSRHSRAPDHQPGRSAWHDRVARRRHGAGRQHVPRRRCRARAGAALRRRLRQGRLAALIGKTVTVDGRIGQGVMTARCRSRRPTRATTKRWRPRRLGRRALAFARHAAFGAAAQDAVDLPTTTLLPIRRRIGEVLAAYKGARGARGGAIASDARRARGHCGRARIHRRRSRLAAAACRRAHRGPRRASSEDKVRA